jgi:hypothetical protein
MPGRFSQGSPSGDERLIRQLPALLREHQPELMRGEHLYRSPAGFTSWSAHWAKAVMVELALEHSESIADHVGIWGAMVCRWAREIGAEPRFLSPALAQAFLQTEQPTLTPDLPRDIACFRLLLPKGTLFSEEGPEIRSVVVADVRAMEGWLPDHFALAGGGLACVGFWGGRLHLPGQQPLGFLLQGTATRAHRFQPNPLGLGCRWREGHSGADGAARRSCPSGAALCALPGG